MPKCVTVANVKPPPEKTVTATATAIVLVPALNVRFVVVPVSHEVATLTVEEPSVIVRVFEFADENVPTLIVWLPLLKLPVVTVNEAPAACVIAADSVQPPPTPSNTILPTFLPPVLIVRPVDVDANVIADVAVLPSVYVIPATSVRLP
jgi:hypothetical protein